MKLELEPTDIETLTLCITQEVLKGLSPALFKHDPAQDTVFTVDTLAQYLQSTPKWVYNHIAALPHFKVDGLLRFRKKEILDSGIMKNNQISLDAKDLLVAIEMAFSKNNERWTYQSLASVLGLSPSQIHASVGRLLISGLLNGKGLKGKVNREALGNFIVHGARYAFPPMLGMPTRGIPTGASSGLFEPELLVQEDGLPTVWPYAHGDARGTSLAPIHPCVPGAILRDSALHKALVYFDALRMGKSRECEAAEAFFRRSLAWLS